MVCPVCTIAVGAGVGILRAYGVDDLITGIWLGALIVSSIVWTLNYLEKKNVQFIFKKIVIILGFYVIFIIPLYFMGVLGMGNKLFGVDRLLSGVVLGSAIFMTSIKSDKYLRTNNAGKVLIPYQKVIVPLAYLIVISIIVYLLLGVVQL